MVVFALVPLPDVYRYNHGESTNHIINNILHPTYHTRCAQKQKPSLQQNILNFFALGAKLI